MDARLILAAQNPDILGNLDRSTQMAARTNAVQDQNRLREVYATQGPGIVAGEEGALNALAMIDPGAALGVQSTRQNMAATQQRMDMLTREEQRALAQYAAGITAQQAEAEAERIRQGVQAASAATTPEQWDALARQFGVPEYAGQFENREAILRKLMSSADFVKQMAGQKVEAKDRYRTVGNQLVDLYAEGGPSSVLSGQTPGQSFSVTMPDGTTVQMGPAGLPTGQNEASTATPRDGGKLADEMAKADAAVLAEVQSAARTAAELESLGRQLETISPNVGYTGPGGGLYGALDDMIGVLPGDEGARGAFRSLAMEAQLSFTEKTKGAITDREMAMFREAVPNLGQTPEANAMIAKVIQAGASRAQTRAAFFENWARKNGSLEGAQEVWTEYMRDNPILEKGENGLTVRPEGEWIGYLNRKPANAYTPEAIMQMGPAELAQIPIERMTETQLDAMERRFQMLGGGQ